MSLAIWLAVLVQSAAQGPFVGDTVWVDREVSAPAGSLLRPLPWDPGPVAMLLGPPEVVVRPGGWMMRYPLVFWEPGRHRFVVPGPLVIRADGGTDTLPPRSAEVVIASLLPAARSDTLPPEPAAALLPSAERSPHPVVVLVLLVALVLVPLHWWWRRRGPAARPPIDSRRAPIPAPAVLAAWGERGEWRTAADGWIAWLEHQPGDPEAQTLASALRAARFESGDDEALARLCRQAAAR